MADRSFSHRRRAIINSDAKNEADDQFALVHALLSPSLDIRGLVAAHFGNRRTRTSMEESRAEIDLLLRLMKLEGQVRVEDGAPYALPDAASPVPAAGVKLYDGTHDFSGANRPIRTYDSIDARFIHEDFFAKLHAFAGPAHGDRGN